MNEYTQKKPKHPAIVYLRQYAAMKLRRDDLKEELLMIRQNATRATSRYTAERMSGTGKKDGMANAAIRSVEVEQMLERCIRNIEEALDIRMLIIEQMKDEREKTLLVEMYISNRDVDEIQNRMFVSRSTFWRIHGSALEHFWKIYLQNNKVETK